MTYRQPEPTGSGHDDERYVMHDDNTAAGEDRSTQALTEHLATLRSMEQRKDELHLAEVRVKHAQAVLELEFSELTGGHFYWLSEAIRGAEAELRRRESAKQVEAAHDLYEWDDEFFDDTSDLGEESEQPIDFDDASVHQHVHVLTEDEDEDDAENGGDR